MAINDVHIIIRRRLNQVGRDIGWKLGLGRNRFITSTGSRMLVYHGICLDHPFQLNTLFVTLKYFEEQLRYYKKYFRLISLDEFFKQESQSNQFGICLSFDDGFANNFKYVLPLLEKYQVPATFFITGIREAGYDILWNDVLAIACKLGPVEFEFRDELYKKNREGKYISLQNGMSLADVLRKKDFLAKEEMIRSFDKLFDFRKRVHEDYWKQMTREQIKTMASNKWVTIGSHGYYHNDLAEMKGDELKFELQASKKFLEKVTLKEIQSIAFPYGSHNMGTIEMARETGYKQLLGTENLYHHDQKLKERFTINPFISTVNQMHANIKGNYD